MIIYISNKIIKFCQSRPTLCIKRFVHKRKVVLFFASRYNIVYIGRNDVTESVVTIRSPFCGYNLANVLS